MDRKKRERTCTVCLFCKVLKLLWDVNKRFVCNFPNNEIKMITRMTK